LFLNVYVILTSILFFLMGYWTVGWKTSSSSSSSSSCWM